MKFDLKNVRGLHLLSQWGRGLLRELGELVLPRTCAGCGRFEQQLCDACWREWQMGAMRVEEHVPALAGRMELPLWAAAVYDGAVRQAIVSIKEGGRVDVHNLVAGAARRAAERIGPTLAAVEAAQKVRPPIRIVPVPARAPAWLSRREIQLPQYFAHHLAEQLDARYMDAQVEELLRHHRFTRDQVGLGRVQRLRNRGGTMRVKSRAFPLGSAPLMIVDDVVTTGATLREATRELTRAGGLVLGGVVLAATPRRFPVPQT